MCSGCNFVRLPILFACPLFYVLRRKWLDVLFLDVLRRRVVAWMCDAVSHMKSYEFALSNEQGYTDAGLHITVHGDSAT